jgi:protein ImuB
MGIATAEILLGICERLLPQLLQPLGERGLGVTRLLAELKGEDNSLGRLVVDLVRPSLNGRHLLELLSLRLESMRMQAPMIGARLAVLDEAPLAVQQQVLFDDLAPPVDSAAWTSLVERLSGRLGAESVASICRRADHQPERAWQARSWIATHRKSARPAKKDLQLKPNVPRPTLLLPMPRAIRVLALAPQGHPRQFDDAGSESHVVRSWGPERIETAWWRGPSIRRDYYRVETEAGAQCWIFRDLRTRRWFLHGWFD